MSFNVRRFVANRAFASFAFVASVVALPLATGCSAADQGGGTLMGGDGTNDGTGSNTESSGSLDNGSGSSSSHSSGSSSSSTSGEDAGSKSASSGGGGTTTTTPASGGSGGGGSTTEAAGTCVKPTDKGTATGIGQYCQQISDCTGSGAANFVCTAMFNAPAGDTFCTSFCNTDADCSDNTTCYTDPATGQAACLTPACLTLAKSKS